MQKKRTPRKRQGSSAAQAAARRRVLRDGYNADAEDLALALGLTMRQFNADNRYEAHGYDLVRLELASQQRPSAFHAAYFEIADQHYADYYESGHGDGLAGLGVPR
jgi:hypothetical protein